MIKRVCIYMAVVLLTLYCFFLYEDEIVAAMLVAELIYFPLAFGYLRLQKRKIIVGLDDVLPIAEKNQEIPVRMTVKNDSVWFAARFLIGLSVENEFTGESFRHEVAGTVKAGQDHKDVFSLRSGRCGNLSISLEKCWLYDILGILRTDLINRKRTAVGRCPVTTALRQSVGILPECHLIPVEVTRRTREFIADADEYSERESGDDPSETYQIRGYREQDSVHDIHWKLSAKADELLVKEHGRPMGCVVLLWLNLEKKPEQKRKHLKKGQKKGRRIASGVLETAASISFSLVEAECVHMAAWYEKANQRICKKRISRLEHVYELMNRLLFVEEYDDQDEVEALYDEAFRGENFSTKVELCSDGTLLVQGEKRCVVPSDEEKIAWDEMYLIV
ncbi:MAG: DUF58 domain-containing protein [Bariatricus sp.]